MTKTHVHIIKTGGTIEFHDPSYDAINKKLLRLDTTIESYLNNLIQPHFDFSVETVCDKDSREIGPEDLEKLSAAIASTSHTNVVVTHGTFTMKDSAQFIEQQSHPDKKVVFTGSMIPISGFSASDAGFNLGFVIASFASIENGVYLSMNGGLFRAGDVTKNEDIFRFE